MMTEHDIKLAQHVSQLAAAFHIYVEVRQKLAPERAGAGHLVVDKTRRSILIAPVTDETTYAVALHELGHCIAPLGMLTDQMSKTMQLTHRVSSVRDVTLQLEEEYAAWAWAMHQALEWTDLMDSVRKMALETYKRNARRILGRLP